MASMTLVKYLALPAGIIIVGIVYWFLSYEAAGSAMLIIFGLAIGVMVFSLGPTAGDVGPTAPVDAEWNQRRT
jgi:hypothetical protein